ncbi:MAG: homoserine dehydrogenase [Anaerolineaceae bacterium 4572_5.2]|nr:MAG: homoserine dehydrogenase [Anaerolineaceae bacterium 4572_5.2]
MHTYRLAMIGFGNVGQGFAQILQERGDDLAQRYGARFQIVAVSDLLKGSVYNPDGFDAGELLQAVRSDGNLDSVDAPHRGWDAMKTISETETDVVIEISYTDLETGEPAVTHARRALELGKHVITTNKGPVALHYPELAALANANNVEIGAEGTVMSGTPALRVGEELLGGAGARKMMGVLNGTTNYILTQMESGMAYEDALAEAQAKGYAEADPTGDVEGHDAAGKVVILANLLMGQSLTMSDVDMQGITGLTSEDIASAQAAGERWKLIGSVEAGEDGFKASVRPIRLPLDHPLASIGGATNAITYTTDLLGDVTLVGPGAGRMETGYALIGDLLAIHRKGAGVVQWERHF